jgi:hypothetical protein
MPIDLNRWSPVEITAGAAFLAATVAAVGSFVVAAVNARSARRLARETARREFRLADAREHREFVARVIAVHREFIADRTGMAGSLTKAATLISSGDHEQGLKEMQAYRFG